MTSGRAATLYTPAVLAAATGLAAWPWDEALPFKGQARSRTCGSAIALGLALDPEGRICTIGLRATACAIGQAAAHAFAGGATGQTPATIAQARAQLGAWLAGEGDLAPLLTLWPGLDTIAPARNVVSRHGAIVLAWDAAIAALA
jgi:NifU-like protein involved in Fe-S cluster formation